MGTISQHECEKKIVEKLKEIKEIYSQYSDGNYLALTLINNSVMFCNRYYDEDKETPINYMQFDSEEEDNKDE